MVDPKIRGRATMFVADYVLERLRDGVPFLQVASGLLVALRQEAKDQRITGALFREAMKDARRGLSLARCRHGREKEIGIRFKDWSASAALDAAQGAR